MADTVGEGFQEFLRVLKTTPAETAAAKGHRSSIDQKMRSDFGMTSMFRTGSFGNGTNVSGFSDVDYFCIIPEDNLSADSDRTLSQIAASMRVRFPTTEGIRKNGPAVRLPFGLDGAESTEIVPVRYTGQTLLDFRSFSMPDRSGGWMFSAPESHNAYVREIDAKLGGELKPLIRFIKAWKYYRNVPINSFYLEMRTARYADTQSVVVHDLDILRIIEGMALDQLAPFIDPRFPDDGQYLHACNSATALTDARIDIGLAFDRANDAFGARMANNDRLAFARWGAFFNGAFPKYSGY